MSAIDDWIKETGDEKLFFKQLDISLDLGLPLLGPVYKPWRPRPKTLGPLKPAVDFVNQYRPVTVRQIYYGLVSRQIIELTEKDYKRMVRIATRARLAGLIPFDAIVDDTRKAEKTPSWEDIQEIMDVAIRQYRSDWWADQDNYVEIWLEKRALRRIFYPITNAYDVHLCVGGGYQSWPEIWEAKKRRFESREGQDIIILYFGDLDPSGKDMPRDIENRFNTLNTPVTMKEIALTREDIEEYNLPRNPMKPKDTRNEWYLRKYGINYAVELDALPPDILREKIEQAILEHVDLDKLLEKRERDEKDRHNMDKWVRLYDDRWLNPPQTKEYEAWLKETGKSSSGKDISLLLRCYYNLGLRQGFNKAIDWCVIVKRGEIEEERKWINDQYKRLEKLSSEELKKIASSPPTGEQHLGHTIQKMAEDVLFARASEKGGGRL